MSVLLEKECQDYHMCRGLAWLDTRCPQKPLYHSPCSAGQGGKKYDKKLMGRDKHRETSLTKYHHRQSRINLGKLV